MSPDSYSGVREYLLNYFSFISKISLFDDYITGRPLRILLYIVIICIFLIALKQVLTLYRETHRKLLLVILSVFLLPTYWLLTNINRLPELLQMKPFIIEGFFIVYSIGLFIIVTLIWVNRKKSSYLDEQSIKVSSFIEEMSINQLTKLSNPDPIETLEKFFSYSFLFLLLSSLPMFFFPNSRIMNVTALGMGGVFGSSFLIVLLMISENRHKAASLFSKKAVLRYALLSVFIMFVLNNGLMFNDKYIEPKLIYKDSNVRVSDIVTYVQLYPEFIKYGMIEQGAYLFHKLVSMGLVDRASGKLNVETIKYLPQIEETLQQNCITENELNTFQPSDAKLYPITD